MKNFALAIMGTIVIYFASLILLTPMINGLGYSTSEVSATHGLLTSLIFLIIICTMLILEALHQGKSE